MNTAVKLQVIDEAMVKEYLLNLVKRVIESNTPHIKVFATVPSSNLDGPIVNVRREIVRELTKDDYDSLINDLEESARFGEGLNLFGLLSNLYIDERSAINGGVWTSYWDLVMNEFEDWKNENLVGMDDDGELTDFYFELDFICEVICQAEDYSPYLNSIVNNLR